MLLNPLPALVIPFPRTFIIKGNANNGRNLFSCPFPAFLTPFQDIAFINEEATSCINEEAIGAINDAAIGAIIALQNPSSCFFISCFTVSVKPSVNKPESSRDLIILIISFISSFEMNKKNLFPDLTAPPSLILLSNLPNIDEFLVANLDKISLSKGAARSISAFLPLPIMLPRNPPDLNILAS